MMTSGIIIFNLYFRSNAYCYILACFFTFFFFYKTLTTDIKCIRFPQSACLCVVTSWIDELISSNITCNCKLLIIEWTRLHTKWEGGREKRFYFEWRSVISSQLSLSIVCWLTTCSAKVAQLCVSPLTVVSHWLHANISHYSPAEHTTKYWLLAKFISFALSKLSLQSTVNFYWFQRTVWKT